jgi:peptide deformylase
MTVKEIIRMGHPTLRTIAEPYPSEQIGSEAFNELIEDMRETLHAAGGIGLAAPQINVSSQIAIVEILDSGTRYGEVATLPFTVFVNPRITVIEPEIAGYWEGCLSIPGMMGYVERPQHINIDYLDQNGNSASLEITGFLATVFQHEFDHLQGKLYIDRIDDLTLFSYEDEYHAFVEAEEDDTTDEEPDR